MAFPFLLDPRLVARALDDLHAIADAARELPAIARGTYVRGRLTVPTRLVVGRSDPVIREAGLDGYQAHADDMTVELIDGGHFLPEERPDAVAERIAQMR